MDIMSLQDELKLLPIDEKEKFKPQQLELVEMILKSFERISQNETISTSENQLNEKSTKKVASIAVVGLILFLILNFSLFKMRYFENEKALSLGLNVLLVIVIAFIIFIV